MNLTVVITGPFSPLTFFRPHGNSLSLPSLDAPPSFSLYRSSAWPHYHRASVPCPNGAMLVAGLLCHCQQLLRLLGGAISSLSSPIHEQVKVKPYSILIYAMEFYFNWKMVSNDCMIRVEASLMDKLNQHIDSWVEHRLYPR